MERVNAQKSLILKETEAYYTEGTLNTWMGTFKRLEAQSTFKRLETQSILLT